MRILFLADDIPPHSPGGAGIIAWHVACAFRDAGHDVHVITTTADETRHFTQDDIPVIAIHARYPMRWRGWLSLYNPQVMRPFKDALKQIRPDVVNAHNVHMNLSYASIVAASKMGIPVTYLAHDVMPFAYGKIDYFINPEQCGAENLAVYRLPRGHNLRQMRLRYNPLRNLVIRRVLTRHTKIRTAVSDALRIALQANGLPPFRVVYNGFDVDAFSRPDEAVINQIKNRLNLNGRIVIFFAGRLTEGKGSRQLLAALNEAVTSQPHLTLLALSATLIDRNLLVGLDNLRDEHLREGGWLTGEELLAAFHLADMVTAPSIIFDSSPTVIFEAMAVGKPVIATCYGGAPETVIDGETGFVINPFDTAQFAEKIVVLASDSALRERFGAAGKRHLKENFSLAKQVAQLTAVFEEAISGSGSPLM
jgi:glycosyltransferase involved in cell wall biosynthesis